MDTRDVFVGVRRKCKDVGLGLRMQQEAANQESCPHKRIMVLPQHNHHQSDHLSSSSCCESSGFDGGSDIGGSMFCNTNNQVADVASFNMGDIYDVVGAASGAVMVSKPDLHTYISTDPSFTFNSSGEMAAPVNVESVPFTASRWQELLRQTLIYKYIMASVSVSPELLIPITKTLSITTPSHNNVVKSSLELGISSNNSNPEPWRCRRTDGKKWRCSRDVAPDQKYCEKHSHKSRPRSRKLVELRAHFTNTNNKTHETHNSLHLASHSTRPCQNSHFISQSNAYFPGNPTLASVTSAYEQPRCLDWFMSITSNSNQEWQQMVHPKVGLRREHQVGG